MVTKKDKKKERLYLLTNNKVKIYTKYDKNQFFNNPLKMKEKGKEKEKPNIKDKEENSKDESKDMIVGDVLEEESEIKDENENEAQNQSFNSLSDKQKENEMKLTGKINIYFKYDKKFVIPKYRMKFSESPNMLYNEGFHIAFGGFWNGDIILKQLIEIKTDTKKNKNRKINIIKTGEMSPITKILIDKTDTIAICSNYEGTIFVYIIDQIDKFNWRILKVINEGQCEISSLAISETLNIFIACFKNGYNMIYTLPNCKLINSFKIEENDIKNKSITKDNNDPNIDIETSSSNNIYSPDMTFISQSPLPCYIFYIKERKSLCVYSINGQFLNELVLKYDIVANGIKKFTDHFFREYLFIYNSLTNTIDVHQLVDLNLIISSPVINHQFVDFQFTKDLDYAFILVKVKQKNDDKSQAHKMMILKQITPETNKFIFY